MDNKIYQKIENIKKLLRQYEYEYYALEQPTVSDYEYDVLLKELIELENQYPNFKTDDSPTNKVGGFVADKFNKVKHETRMLSLSNAFSKEDLIKFDLDIKKAIPNKKNQYVVEPKIDGLSLSLKYKNGSFHQAVTRGDGEVGEDVTANVKTIKGIPLSIDYKDELEVRGEVFLTKENFAKINSDPNLVKKFANARNAASGSLRNLDTTITANRNLSALFYFIPNALNQLHIESQYKVLQWLDSIKIPRSNEIKKYDSIEEVIKRVEEITEKRNQFKFDIDGIVIKVDNINFYEEIGYTAKFPKWAIAYKFPANIKESKLLSIDITVGRTGRINYIANINPTLLDGSMISKATLHNAEYISEKDIRINDTIEIYKAGDVIPKIIRPLIEKREGNEVVFEAPTNCPSCNSFLVQFDNEVDLYCINDECKEKIIQEICHFCTRDALNIEGLSDAIVRKLYDNNLIKDYTDLYLLKYKKEQILSLDLLIKEKSFNNLINAIESSKKHSIEKLIFGLGIKHVGFNMAKQLAKRFKNMKGFKNATIDEIVSIGNIGIKIAESLTNWFKQEKNILKIKKLESYGLNFSYINEFEDVTIDENNMKYKNKSFVITGSFNINRSVIKNIIESVYHSKVSSSVTKKTDYLIIGNNATESKIEKAKELNITIIEEEFWNIK